MDDVGQQEHVGGDIADHAVRAAFAEGVPAAVAVFDALDKVGLGEAALDIAPEDGGILAAKAFHFRFEAVARLGVLHPGIGVLEQVLKG